MKCSKGFTAQIKAEERVVGELKLFSEFVSLKVLLQVGVSGILRSILVERVEIGPSLNF